MKKPLDCSVQTGIITEKTNLSVLCYITDQIIVRTVMILSFRTDTPGQTVQTQIRLLLEEQSDQGLHCLLFHLHLFDEIPESFASLFEF